MNVLAYVNECGRKIDVLFGKGTRALTMVRMTLAGQDLEHPKRCNVTHCHFVLAIWKVMAPYTHLYQIGNDCYGLSNIVEFSNDVVEASSAVLSTSETL